ncbi:MAG: Calx-beta domain-containing protein [Flammeovirgaceae bacterium]
MKKYLIIGMFLLALASCEEQEFSFTETHVRFETSASSALESASGTIDVPIIVSSVDRSQAVTVSVSVEGTAVEGTDYNLVTTSDVTIAANEISGVFQLSMIDNIEKDGNKTLTLTITSNSQNATIGFPGPDGLQGSHTLTIEDDDLCDIKAALWFGTVNLEDVGFGTLTGTGVNPGECSKLTISNPGDFIGSSVPGNDFTINFTEDSPGATFGTVSVDRYFYWSTRVEYEGTGVYDEATQEILIDYTAYLDGGVWYTGQTKITPN